MSNEIISIFMSVNGDTDGQWATSGVGNLLSIASRMSYHNVSRGPHELPWRFKRAKYFIKLSNFFWYYFKWSLSFWTSAKIIWIFFFFFFLVFFPRAWDEALWTWYGPQAPHPELASSGASARVHFAHDLYSTQKR